VSGAAVRLPIAVDDAALRADLDRLAAADWVPHFNTAYYEGDWSVVSLRSTSGRADQIYPDPTATEYADTPLLARCPGVGALLAQLGAPLLAVRFMRLGPGARLKEHTDLNLGVDDGEVRLHAPVLTNDSVGFTLDGVPVDMRPGELWYLDLNRKHAARNDGTTPRVHLVVDCVVDDALRALIATPPPTGG
jgi:hypothetical protein